MFSLTISIIDALLSVFGLTVIVAMIYTLYNYKTKTLTSEQWKCLGHTFNLETTKGKEFIFTIKRN